MRLFKISVTVTPQSEDAVVDLMSGLFRQPASVFEDVEAGTMAASVYLPGAAGLSASRRARLREGLKRIRSFGLELGAARISVRRLAREDWAESWKRHFKPILIGSELLVKPSWSPRRALPGQAVVVLDPGLSFGTGQHPTTRFCLEQIVASRPGTRPRSLLDMGTGSGILAIAAAKLGYGPVEAFDFDPAAVRIARANATLNHIQRRVTFHQQDLTRRPFSGQKFDVVCANLLYDLLLSQRRRIVANVRKGGLLVLAGILGSQFPAVAKAYVEGGLTLEAHRRENEWESGAFRLTGG